MKTKISLILLFMLYVGLLLFWYKLTLGSTSAIGGAILLFLFFISLIFVAAIDWILLKKLLGKNIIIVLEITLLFLLFLIYSVNTASFYYNVNEKVNWFVVVYNGNSSNHNVYTSFPLNKKIDVNNQDIICLEKKTIGFRNEFINQKSYFPYRGWRKYSKTYNNFDYKIYEIEPYKLTQNDSVFIENSLDKLCK